MTCWAVAAAYLADHSLYDEGLDVLMRSGRLPHVGGMTRSRWLALGALWSRYGVAIQHYITIPFLRGVIDRMRA